MLNNVNLIGRLTRDPILGYTNNGIPVLNFSIAVNGRYVKDKEQEVHFFNVVAWQGTAEYVARNFTKGQPICVEGRLQQRRWDDKDTKEARSVVEIVAGEVHFAGFKREANQYADTGTDGVYTPDFDPYGQPAAYEQPAAA